MQILVVDDEEHLRRMMRITLEASGYTVSLHWYSGVGTIHCA